jgi:hypothetical protein
VERLKQLPAWGFYVLLAYMPFHIFLSQSLSLISGGLPVWKISKDVLTMLLTALTVGLVYQLKRSNRAFDLLVLGTALYGIVHLLVWFFNPDIYQPTAVLGTVYNNRLLWFAVLGAGAHLLAPTVLTTKRAIKVLLIVSTIVCALGIIQYFLPKDILSHVGYSLERGVRPAFFIDDKPDLPRIMSTLRDPNSLGGFLVVPITLIARLLLKAKGANKKMLLVGMMGLHGLALLLTFSRSAWLATTVSMVLLLVIRGQAALARAIKRFRLLVVAFVLALSFGAIALKDQYVIQNILFHSDESTVSELDSNEYHLSFAQKGLVGVADQPLGHGPGTAGIVSIQNPTGGLLTENYYIQIGYEIGLIGLGLFIFLQAWLYLELKKRSLPGVGVLLASFWGYVLTSMLLHTWTNEAVAITWWGLAGVYLVARPKTLRQ